MRPKITFNDAWEGIPLDCAEDAIEFLDRELQPNHPLRAYKVFPIAKLWRRYEVVPKRRTENRASMHDEALERNLG
jgi:hypothetical protein